VTWVDWVRGAEVEPSIYAADFADLGSQLRSLLDAGARIFHVDVGDGHFIREITIGPVVLRSIAGLVGPAIVSYIRQWQLGRGAAPVEAYSVTMYVLASLLAVGFVCNLLVRPVADKYFMTDEDLRRETSAPAK